MEFLHCIVMLSRLFFIYPTLLCSMRELHADSAIFQNQTDEVALLKFKDGIADDPHGIMSSWNTSLHFCKWRGVTCDGQLQTITTLDLNSLNLAGVISPHIVNLTFLRKIDLSNNKFFGEIPRELGRLARMQHLNLTQNSLGGEIPTNLSHCADLRVIHLNYNELIGEIPVELGSLSKLTMLDLAVNDLAGRIPPSLGNLSSLIELSLLRNNFFGSIPESLGQLKKLQFFQISANNITGTIPSPLYNLSSIYYFAVAGNQLHGSLPPDIGLRFPKLQSLLLGINGFSGLIPASLSNSSKLVQIDMPSNEFRGQVPFSLGELQALSRLNVAGNQLGSGEFDDLAFLTYLTNCTRLEVLDIDTNLFDSILPNSIANLSTHLRYFLIGGNKISGVIPVEIENLFNLTVLGMEQNVLTGSIPASIGKLQKLQALVLGTNKLSGQIPSSLGNLTLLYKLDLQENNLQGHIPVNFANCKYLQILDLSSNSLNGTIPKEVVSMSSLSTTLNLAWNFLVGALPDEIGNAKNLEGLNVSENRLSGEIPSSLGSCLRLERLYMAGNSFQGSIPTSLLNLKALQDIDLSRNNLTGRIPEYLESLPFLQNLNLNFNDLDGEVPIRGVFQNASVVSVLGNNKLCGGIPELQLPTCTLQPSKTSGRSTSILIKILIPVISSVLCLCLLSCIIVRNYLRKRSVNKSSDTQTDEKYFKVSYGDLLKATDGFSSRNLIGFGSYGSVYKGILHVEETLVAVKVLNLQQRGASKSFMAECEALRSIRHRNLVKIITTCSSMDYGGNEFKALVFEFMPNGSLEKWLHPKVDGEHQLNFIQRLNIAIDVASALDYLHCNCEIPIIHCDLKPSNVLLNEDMMARVGDFGLARFLNKNSTISFQNQTSSAGLKGSIGYVAPEYGTGAQVSTEGDVYSYGILLLEMFTGKSPTDDMFKEGLNLHKFVETGLPKRVMDIADPRLFFEENQALDGIGNSSDVICTMKECLVSLLTIGILCSSELPRKRMPMKDVLEALHGIRDLSKEVQN